MAETRVKAITSIPGWSDLFTTNEINSAAQAYAYVPLVHRAIRLRCDSLASVPMMIYRGDDEVEWPFQEKLYNLIWQTEAALLMNGAGYWEPIANVAGKVKDIKWRNPFSIEVKYEARTLNKNGREAGREHLLHFKQTTTGSTATWTNNLTAGKYEMIYFREFSPGDDMLPGVAAAEVAMTEAKLMRYISRFAAIFFEQGAMPVLLLPFEQIGEAEARKVESFFQRQATGIRNAFRVLALRGKVTPTPITPRVVQAEPGPIPIKSPLTPVSINSIAT